MSADYDLLIVGAGPAGLAAALAAAPSGARIALVDDNPAAGGQIWRDGSRASLPPRAHQMRQRLAGQANVEHFPATRVVACGPGRRLLLEDPQRGWQVGYRRLVLCTGARELLLPFPGWTLPGVTGAGGLQALARAACHWPASAWWWLAPARCCWPAPPAPASAGRACCASPNRRRREPWPPSPYACRAGPASCGRPPACSPVATAPTATCSPPSARSA